MFKIIKRIIIFILIIFIAICSYIIYEGYTLYKDAITETSIDEKVKSIKADKDYIESDKMPTDFKNAVVAIEDHRFPKHNGVDLISIARAFFVNIDAKTLAEGGSTITQQLAKNMYFEQEKKFSRKVAEVFVAFNLEEKYDKDEILTLYVNIIYYGNGYYGVNPASLGYFKKLPMELDLNEITMLAGIPNAPSIYSSKDNIELAKNRQKVVVSSMVENGYLSKEEANKLLSDNSNN